jgi:hypothetical protein
MQLKIIAAAISIFFFILPLVYPLVDATDNNIPPSWNTQWSFSQKIELPIMTNDSISQNQPIDIQIVFNNPCWTKNENQTSVRITCWSKQRWYELESQIYNLVFTDANHIEKCNVVFLIPIYADGCEQYYIYYNDNPTPLSDYKDHVNVKDAHYIESPISEVTAEAQYYRIEEEGFCVYGVGQEGTLLDRSFSQIVVKQKKGVKDFEVFNADQIVSFAFSYYYGNKEIDESASDQRFVQKKIFSDGNLMVSFGIISESEKKDIRTTAIYKYYYTPGDDKRIDVHIKHEMLDDALVQGIDNVDGRFGAMVSLVSRNPVVDRLNFGEIYPYLDFYSEENYVKEYTMNQNPETSTREWIVPYTDDADLGNEAWLTYGQGKIGKTHAVIFPSNTGFIHSGTDERDGIQLKVAEKEYFNFLGTEVDYASINFGRNSYEKGYSHDVQIPKNLIVEFNAEVYTTEKGGYPTIQNESRIYRRLIQSRQGGQDTSFEPEPKKYNLTLITHFGGTRFSYPILVNQTHMRFSTMWIEIYRDGRLITSGSTDRSLFMRSYKTITDLEEGDYLIKVYRRRDNATKFLVGEKSLSLQENTKIQVYCTWERNIQVNIADQYDEPVNGIILQIRTKEGDIYGENTTGTTGEGEIQVPYNPRDAYLIQAWYKDFLIYESALNQTLKKTTLKLTLNLYDITVKVTDKLDSPPGVPVFPMLSIVQHNMSLEQIPEIKESGVFVFHKIPAGAYNLQISYGTFIDKKNVNVPNDGSSISLIFSAEFEISIDLFDATGTPLNDNNIHFDIIRNETKVATSKNLGISLPPGYYTIKAYSSEESVGIKTIELTNDRSIKFVTTITSPVPSILIIILTIFACSIIIAGFLKKISLTTICKLLALICIIIALVQPWWMLSGSSTTPQIVRETKMLVNPPAMIESIKINDAITMDIAEMPELFIGVLGINVIALIGTCILITLSILLTLQKKKHYSTILTFLSSILLVIIIITFSISATKICEISIGSVQGQGNLGVSNQGETVMLSSQWGFALGYYIIIIAIILIILAGILEIKKIFINNKKSLK